jgi:ankyrin repeat protein
VANETRDDQQQHIYLGPPLQIAAVRDDQPIAELLLAHKADPNVTDRAGSTPLHTTASRGNQKLTELLLANKAAVDPVNKAGETPLDLAAKSSAEITTILLAHGANVNATNAVSGAYEGWSPLIYAITSRQKEVVDILLKDKANPNLSAERYGTVSSRGFSPLVLAVWQADPDIVASMLNGKADPNLKNGSGLSPALAAITVNDASTRKRILSLLLDHGADTEARYSDDRTPLIAAVERKDKETVELLLAHKADPNAREPKSGNAALHYAVLSVSSGDLPELVPSIVETLLAAGANPNLQNGEGKTPLNYLQSPLNSVRAKIRGLLVAHGAVEDLPRLDVVEVRRPEANFSKIIFTKGTNGWDQFTLFDLIGVQYKLLTASTSGEGRVVSAPYSKFAHNSGLDFPDFTRIRIRHPKPDFKSWNERTVNVASALTSRDCSADITLEPGDEVEIPEADHIRYATWNGLPNATLESLKKCLTRRVSIIVKGQTSMITLAPDISFYKVATDNVESGGQIVQGAQTEANLKQFAPFMIMPVLTNSKLLLASSDLSRIKLLRTDKDGQKRELIVDCSEGKPAPSVWLRDGDVIEVPDKP